MVNSCLVPVDPIFWQILLVIAVGLMIWFVGLGAAAVIRAVREGPPPGGGGGGGERYERREGGGRYA